MSCGCNSKTTGGTALLPSPCDDPSIPGLERTRFYPRMLVGPGDLTQDQIYFREKMRRHNRMLHGWGVVCGVEVTKTGKCEVVVHPGYVLGPYGDEIVIPKEVTLDLCKMGTGEVLGCCPDGYDPWCSDPRNSCDVGEKFLAVRYAECLSTPVRASGGGCGCGCDESACEHSRVRDSYAFQLLDALPEGYDVLGQLFGSAMAACVNGRGRSCPPCPKFPWVVIARVTINADCVITVVDCFSHRRYVVSFGSVALNCIPRRGPRYDYIDTSHVLSAYGRMAGSSLRALIDLRDNPSATPRATVRMVDVSGEPVMVPIPDELIADNPTKISTLLDRAREWRALDPEVGVVDARDIVLGAGVSESATVHGVEGIIKLLADKEYRAPELRNQRAELGGLIGARAIDTLSRKKLALHESPDLSAELIRPSDVPQPVLDAIGKRSIAKLAAMKKTALAAMVSKGAKAGDQPALEEAAEALRQKAIRIVGLAKGLGHA